MGMARVSGYLLEPSLDIARQSLCRDLSPSDSQCVLSCCHFPWGWIVDPRARQAKASQSESPAMCASQHVCDGSVSFGSEVI